MAMTKSTTAVLFAVSAMMLSTTRLGGSGFSVGPGVGPCRARHGRSTATAFIQTRECWDFCVLWGGVGQSENNEQNHNNGEENLGDKLSILQSQLSLIEALEERNKAQLDSFVDEQDQWDSLEEEEQELLLQKNAIVARIEELSKELG